MESFVSIKKTHMGASFFHALLKALTVRGFPSPRQFQLITLIEPGDAAKQPPPILDYLP